MKGIEAKDAIGRAEKLARRAGRGIAELGSETSAAIRTLSGRAAPVMERALSRASGLLDREVIARRSATVPGESTVPGEPIAPGQPDRRPPPGRFEMPPLDALRPEAQAAVDEIAAALIGHDRTVRLAIACFVANGHLLLEGPPGLGKTTLASALGAVTGRRCRRIQFTADLMPGDILGVPVYEAGKGVFVFHKGPIFSEMVLADEINRAPPRVHSALLEAMEEVRVSVDGESHALPEGFFVVATQNPVGQIGAFPLPESQLDRFLMCLEFSHPARADELDVLRAGDMRSRAATLSAVGAGLPRRADGPVADITVAEPVLRYVQALIETSRDPGRFATGLSVRAGLSLLRAARAWAWMHDRRWVEPEDVQSVFAAVAGHRIVGHAGAGQGAAPGTASGAGRPADAILNAVAVD